MFEEYRRIYGGDTLINFYACEDDDVVQFFSLSKDTEYDEPCLDIRLNYE